MLRSVPFAVLLLFSCVAFSIRASEQPIGFYENMSALGFVHAVEVYKLQKLDDEKLITAGIVSSTMFTYWLQTHVGKLRRSAKVDVAILRTYQDVFRNEKLCVRKQLFLDPLQWLDGEKTSMRMPRGFSDLTRERYMALRKAYVGFLETNPDELRKHGRIGSGVRH